MTRDNMNKPFAMIREFHLADWFTLANAVCGTGAIFSMLTYLQIHDVSHVFFACGLVFAALIFDVLDGRIARWRQKNSVLGRELDSPADVISFGVAPAVIGYGCGMQGLYDRIIPDLFCGMWRIPSGALHCYSRDAVRGGGQSEVLRGHPDPDVAFAGNVDVLGGLARRIARVPLVRAGTVCRFYASSDCIVFRGFRLANDQSHTDSKTLSCPHPMLKNAARPPRP
jgi:CDP-diacylglycerol--serine O-phosphatidyltransferase